MPEFDVNIDCWGDERYVGHVPDLAGCFVIGKDVDDVVTAVPETIRKYHQWLTDLDVELEPPPEPITGRVETILESAREIFPTDKQPVSPTEVDWHLQLAQFNRQELLAMIESMPAEMLDWKPFAERMTIREIAHHVASSELWYLSRITELQKEPDLELLPYLDWSRTAVISTLSQLNETQRTEVVTQPQLTRFPDEPWTARKVLRRLLEHEREHIAHIHEVLAEWRLHFNARLEAERIGFLWSMRGLSEATMAQPDVMPDWSVKDMVTHVAYYDGFHTNRMHMVANGRIAEIKEIGEEEALAKYNSELNTQFKEVGMEAAIAMLLKERSGFKANFKRLSDADIHQKIELSWGWKTSIHDWAIWRYLHDAEHGNEINEWRKNLSKKQQFDFTPKYLLRAMLKSSRKAFTTLLPLLPKDEWTTRPVCGSWTLKDLLGHITDWEVVAVTAMEQLVAGQLPEFEVEIPDFDTFNNANAVARNEQSWDEVWQDYANVRTQLLSALDAVDDEMLTRKFQTPWGRPLRGDYWMLIWPGHEQEHAVDVRAALELWNWPERLTLHQ